jgi:hypothetical protein
MSDFVDPYELSARKGSALDVLTRTMHGALEQADAARRTRRRATAVALLIGLAIGGAFGVAAEHQRAVIHCGK